MNEALKTISLLLFHLEVNRAKFSRVDGVVYEFFSMDFEIDKNEYE